MTVKDPSHVHKWSRAWTRGFDYVGFSCPCGEKMERKATPAEARRIKADWKRSNARSRVMHGVNWEFAKRFRTEDGGWKYESYDLMTRVRKWARKHPKDVMVCGIDDSYNANSDVVFVLHRIGKRLWGTTVYVITQCDGQRPHEWFMYPGHRQGIQEALAWMARFKAFKYS